MALIELEVSVQLSIAGMGPISDTDLPRGTTVSVVGPFTLSVDNGTRPGDIRERKAEFQLAFDPTNIAGIESLLEGANCDITITYAWATWTMTRFFISEVAWSPRAGVVIADVLALSDNAKIAYEPAGKWKTPIMRDKVWNRVSPDRVFRQAPDGEMARPHPIVSYRENNRIGAAWHDDIEYSWQWPTNIELDYDDVKQKGEDDFAGLISHVGRVMFARCYIESGVFGFIVARFGMTGFLDDNTYRIPPRYVEADEAVSFKVTDMPNTYAFNWAEANPVHSVPGEVERFAQVTDETDFGEHVHSENMTTLETITLHDLARVRAQRPRSRWRLSQATVNLERWAGADFDGRNESTHLVRNIFWTPIGTDTYLPSVVVPMERSRSGLPSELFGIVDAATLTINPLGSALPRAELNLTLGPGDGRGIGTSRWSDLRATWDTYDTEWSVI